MAWHALMPVPVLALVTVHQCSECGITFTDTARAREHVARKHITHGRMATILTKHAGVVELPDTYPTRKRQRQNVLLPPLELEQGVIAANTAEESAELRRRILDPALRHALLTAPIASAPAIVFRMTKGTNGPRCLRNVNKTGTHSVVENGKTHNTLEYVRSAAVRLVAELQAALEIAPDSTLELVDWANGMSGRLNKTMSHGTSYADALNMYAKSDTSFYKLPKDVRVVIAGGVKAIVNCISSAP